MGVIHLFVPADGVHIREQTLAHIELIFLQRQALPLGQRMHHLGVGTNIGDVEGNGALDTVEVIVQTRILINEQGSRHPAQIQCLTEVDLEIALDELNGALHFVHGKRRFVPFRNNDLTHVGYHLSIKIMN